MNPMWKSVFVSCSVLSDISNFLFSFFGQVSNVLFFLFPPVLIHLFQEYARVINPAINVLWVLMMVVGLSSAYFHATLSLVGKVTHIWGLVNKQCLWCVFCISTQLTAACYCIMFFTELCLVHNIRYNYKNRLFKWVIKSCLLAYTKHQG